MNRFSLYDVRQAGRKVQNALSNYSRAENLIREATNTDAWGPTTHQLFEINETVLGESLDQKRLYDDFSDGYDYDSPSAGSFAEDTVNFIVKRLREYSGTHVAFQANNEGLLTKLKKSVVTNGVEHIIVLKSLKVIEHLLINCHSPGGFDIKNSFSNQKELLREISTRYQCVYASDNRSAQHTKVIRGKAESVLRMLTEEAYLDEQRSKFHSAYEKIASSSASNGLNANASNALDSSPPSRTRLGSLSDVVSGFRAGGSRRTAHFQEQGSLRLNDDDDDDLNLYSAGNSYNDYPDTAQTSRLDYIAAEPAPQLQPMRENLSGQGAKQFKVESTIPRGTDLLGDFLPSTPPKTTVSFPISPVSPFGIGSMNHPNDSPIQHRRQSAEKGAEKSAEKSAVSPFDDLLRKAKSDV